MSDTIISGRYDDAGIHTWKFDNFRPVVEFLTRSPERITVLCESRPELLTEILGPKRQTWVGGSRYARFFIWRADAEGLPIWILCSKFGTSYELEHAGTPWNGEITDVEQAKLVRFLARLYLQMEDLMPVHKYGPIITEADDPLLRAARVDLDSVNDAQLR
jgi:hypothetical protein